MKQRTQNIDTMTIQNVTIGDKFKKSNCKNTEFEVADFLEVKSMITGEVVGYKCIAKGNGLATNRHEVPFATVVRGLVKN